MISNGNTPGLTLKQSFANAMVGSYSGNGYVHSSNSNFVANCTCNMAWHGVVAPPACPVHSGVGNLQSIQQWHDCFPGYDWPDWPDFDEVSDEEAIAGLQEIIEELQ